MHILPFSTDRGQACGLPLPEGAASRLADLWLVERHDPQRSQALQLVRSEPTLAIWATCRFRETRQRTATTPQQLAEWLETEGISAWRLTAEVVDRGHRELSDQAVLGWAELACHRVQIAERASQLVSEAHRDCAYLAGLCHAAEGLCLSTDGATARLNGIRPATGLSDASARELVEQAVATAEGECHAAETDVSLNPDLSRRLEQTRATWISAARSWSRGLEELVQKLRQLRRWESKFHEVLEQEKLTALKEFAYGASHELNNPLANISTRAQTLLRDERDPERRRKLATINSQAFRAHEMISDLMLFARPPMIEPQPMLILPLAERVLGELRDTAANQGTRLTNLASDPDVQLLADATYLGVALKSLCLNSLEALGSGGWVELDIQRAARPEDEGAAADSEFVEITVRDNGPGISEEARPHVFDPYFSGREAGRGLGLGLSKCWRIVTLHGGQIRLDSSDKGTTFTLCLPQPPAARPGSEPAELLAGSGGR